MKKYLILLPLLVFAPIANAQDLLATGVTRVFDRNLSIGSMGDDVRDLQRLLNQHKVETKVSATGVGSLGNETTYFGAKTKNAVVVFQKMHNIPATGFVGPLTREALNKLTIAIVPPSNNGIFTERQGNTTEVLFFYNGGGEKSSIWFTYGSSPETMSITSPKAEGKSVEGIAKISIENPGAQCFVRAYIQNSQGMTSSQIKEC